jgi:hypothetical protein
MVDDFAEDGDGAAATVRLAAALLEEARKGN